MAIRWLMMHRGVALLAVGGFVLLAALLVLTSAPSGPAAATGAVNSIVEPDPSAYARSGSLVLDTVGNPVVSYQATNDGQTGALNLLHCSDADCLASNSISTVDSSVNVSVSSSSLALDTNGYPVVSYYDVTNRDLRVLHCNDPDCLGNDESIVSPDTVGDVGALSSLVLDPDGKPVVSYLDETSSLRLKVLHCGDVNCLAGNSTSTVATDAQGSSAPDLILDALGRPIIAYVAQYPNVISLKTIHCGDVNCSSANAVVEPVQAWIWSPSLTLDASGNPVVAYYDHTNNVVDAVMVLHCGNPDCSANNVISVGDAAVQGSYSVDMKLDAAGNPVLSYYVQYSNGNLRVLHCGNPTCNSSNIISAPDTQGDVGTASSLQLDASGNPVVAYLGRPGNSLYSLKLLHCVTASCLSKGETPVANPTAMATPTPQPCPPYCGLDFSIGTDVAGGSALPCDSSGSPSATCDVPLGAKFKVSFYVHSLPATIHNGVSGEDETLQYAGITSSELQDSVNQTYWPPCVGPTGGVFSPGQVSMACSVLVGPPSTYVGRFSTVEFTCSANGSVTLRSGDGWTDVADDDLNFYSEAADESLTIHCVAPQAYPGDTDGDGCPDAKEAGSNAMMGGQRNFLNPWDYFNPSGDGTNRVDDILMVLQHFGLNTGDPGYDVKYDRTYIGPNKWNLGPPDGKIRVNDILAAVAQYGYDCS